MGAGTRGAPSMESPVQTLHAPTPSGPPTFLPGAESGTQTETPSALAHPRGTAPWETRPAPPAPAPAQKSVLRPRGQRRKRPKSKAGRAGAVPPKDGWRWVFLANERRVACGVRRRWADARVFKTSFGVSRPQARTVQGTPFLGGGSWRRWPGLGRGPDGAGVGGGLRSALLFSLGIEKQRGGEGRRRWAPLG